MGANQQDRSLLQSNATRGCTNPASLDPEVMHCRCYDKLIKAGKCEHNAQDQYKCAQCQICKEESFWPQPLCADWKKAVCSKEYLGNGCDYQGANELLEQRSKDKQS